jgi:PKD repeat protein
MGGVAVPRCLSLGRYVSYTLSVVAPVVANFSADPLSGDAPLDVQFTDLSTGNPTSWLWDFGDGETSTEQNPLHTYAEAGTYTVTLIAVGSGGSNTEAKVDYIAVADVPTGIPGTWLITTSTAGLARMGSFGGAWANISMPGTFTPSTGNGAVGLPIIPDGAGGTLIAGTPASGTSFGIFSADSTTWSAIGSINGWMTSVIHAFAKYIAPLEPSGAYVAESADGPNWTTDQVFPDDFEKYWSVVQHVDGYVYMAGQHVDGGVGVIRTNNGTSWSIVRTPALDTPFLSDGQCFLLSDTANGRLIVMDRKGRVSTTSNGTTWTALTDTAITAAANWDDWLTDVAIGTDGTIVAVTDDSAPNVWVAGSDLAFSGQTMPAETWLYAATYSGGYFIVVGDNSCVFTSPTAIAGSWTQQDAGFAAGKKLTGIARIA